MSDQINNIRIKDWFWIHFHASFISFGFKSLPDDVHFTLACNEESPDLNLHITRNIGVPHKPRIELVRVNKSEFEKMAPYAIMSLINLFIKPFNLRKHLRKHKKKGLKFIPIEALQSGQCATDMESLLVDGFKPLTKIKKTRRLKIDGDLEGKTMELIQSPAMLDNMRNARQNFTYRSLKSVKGGIFRINKKTTALLQIQGKWFEYSKKPLPIDLLASVVGQEYALYLTRYLKKSIIRVKNAKTAAETEQWNFPLVLVANPAVTSS
jgi:hypothetical protein